MTAQTVAVPLESSIPLGEQGKEDLYNSIRRASVRWGSNAGDVAHTAYLKATRLGYYTSGTIRQAARDLGIFSASHEVELTDDLPSGAPNLETEALASERDAAVRAAIAQLSPHCRAVVTMRHFKGMTLAEIAEAIGMSVGVVHSCLMQAEAALRLLLSDYAPSQRRKSASDSDLPLFGEVAA